MQRSVHVPLIVDGESNSRCAQRLVDRHQRKRRALTALRVTPRLRRLDALHSGVVQKRNIHREACDISLQLARLSRQGARYSMIRLAPSGSPREGHRLLLL